MSWKNPIKPKSDVPSFNDVMEDKSSVPSFSEVMDEKKNGGESGLEPSAPTTSQSSEDYSGKRPSAYALKPNISPNLTGTPVPTTLDEANQQDTDKSKAVGSNLWNRFLTGIGEMSSGAGDLIFQGIQKIMPPDPYSKGAEQDLKNFRQEGEPTIRTATKELAGAKVTPQQEKNFNDNFWTNALGGLAQTVPAMMGTKGSGFFLQAYDNGLQAIDNAPAGKDLPESTKTIFGLGVGAAQAVILKTGLDKIFGKQSTKVATNLAIQTFSNLLKTSETPITAELFESALATAAKSLKSKVLDAGVKVGTSAATGFLIGSAIEGSNELAKAITNDNVDGKDVFEPTTWGQKLSNVLNAGASTAVGGALLGAASLPFSKTRNYIAEKVADAKSTGDIIRLKDELALSKEGGKLSDDEVRHLDSMVDDYVRVNAKIPDDVPNRKEVADKILEREDVDKTISDKSQQLSTVDEAFKPDISKEISVLNDRSQEINNEITNPTIETKNAEEIKNEIPIPTEETSVTNEGTNKVEQPTEDFIKKSDAEIEKRMLEIQDNNPSFDSKDQSEFNTLEKEMEKRERASVFNVPLEKVSDAVDALMKKEKEQPNGFGSFIEKKDASETKQVAEKYSNPKDISDAELKKDFRDAVTGNPDTWYADGLKLRESMKEASNRGVDSKELIAEVEKEYVKDGYTPQDAQRTVARKLKPIFEGSQKVNEKQLAQPIEEHPDIKKLEEQKSDEIKEVSKPDVKLNLISNKDLVNSKDPVETKRIHDKIKDGYKILKQMVDCL